MINKNNLDQEAKNEWKILHATKLSPYALKISNHPKWEPRIRKCCSTIIKPRELHTKDHPNHQILMKWKPRPRGSNKKKRSRIQRRSLNNEVNRGRKPKDEYLLKTQNNSNHQIKTNPHQRFKLASYIFPIIRNCMRKCKHSYNLTYLSTIRNPQFGGCGLRKHTTQLINQTASRNP